jgi:thiol-disulfide isomerase/thioredoxin
MSFARFLVLGSLVAFAGCGDDVPELPPPPVANLPAPVVPPAEASQKLLTEAKERLNQNDLPAGLTLLEHAITADPKNREALLLLAASCQVYAEAVGSPANGPAYHRSVLAMQSLRDHFPDLTDTERDVLAEGLFREGCAYAAENKTEAALEHLDQAASAGFSQRDTVKEERSLDSLRKLPRFEAFAKQIDQRAHAVADQKASAILEKTKAFPFDFAYPGLDGKTVALADFRGQVVLVDIWGTWCMPCRRVIPHLVELDKTRRNKGLRVIGMNVEQVPPGEAVDLIRAVVETLEISYPCVIGDDRIINQVPRFAAYPTTVLVDRRGQARAQVVGTGPGTDLLIDALVTRLLDEPAPPPSKQ